MCTTTGFSDVWNGLMRQLNNVLSAAHTKDGEQDFYFESRKFLSDFKKFSRDFGAPSNGEALDNIQIARGVLYAMGYTPEDEVIRRLLEEEKKLSGVPHE